MKWIRKIFYVENIYFAILVNYNAKFEYVKNMQNHEFANHLMREHNTLYSIVFSNDLHMHIDKLDVNILSCLIVFKFQN